MVYIARNKVGRVTHNMDNDMKIYVYPDEKYPHYYVEVSEPFSSYYKPIEIPDEEWEAYKNVREAFSV